MLEYARVMEILETLFSSRPRVEVLRMFLFQPGKKLSAGDIARQTGIAKSTARTHAKALAKINLLHDAQSAVGDSGQEQEVWELNKSSSLRPHLHQLFLAHQNITPEDIKEELLALVDVSFLALSGVFSGVDDRPVDILIAGQKINSKKLKKTLSKLERRLGTELRYASMSEEEFRYRFDVQDKLVREVLDYPHRRLVDALI